MSRHILWYHSSFSCVWFCETHLQYNVNFNHSLPICTLWNKFWICFLHPCSCLYFQRYVCSWYWEIYTSWGPFPIAKNIELSLYHSWYVFWNLVNKIFLNLELNLSKLSVHTSTTVLLLYEICRSNMHSIPWGYIQISIETHGLVTNIISLGHRKVPTGDV